MISDERLREAARKAEESLLASLPEPEECETAFSPEFERKMEKLIHRAKHPIRHRIMKAVACFLLVILVGGGSVLTFSMEARAAFVGWVREVYETYFEYHYTGIDRNITNDVIYWPTWLPNGYDLVIEPEPGDHIVAIYESTQEDKIIFNCSTSIESLTLQVEREGTETFTVSVNGISADLYLDQDENNANVLVWEDESAGLIFWIVATCDTDDLVKIAESVKPAG